MKVTIVGTFPQYLLLDFTQPVSDALIHDLSNLKLGYKATKRHPKEVMVTKPPLNSLRDAADVVKPILIKHGLTIEEHCL